MPSPIEAVLMIVCLAVAAQWLLHWQAERDWQRRFQLACESSYANERHFRDTLQAMARWQFDIETRVMDLEGLRESTILKRPLKSVARR